jgi:hypothetical protein
MNRWGITAVAAFAAIAVATTASADTKALAKAGSWEAFGGTTTTGRGVCGISATIGPRYFGLKLFAGNQTFTIQMGTGQWTVTDGEKIGVTMRLDANPFWRATATSFHFEDKDAGLEFTINRAEIDKFAQEFRNSSQLKIQFGDNRFPEWLFGLEGTMAVNGAFQICMRGLK